MLIMLQDKADSSMVNALSNQTASLLKSNSELNNHILTLFGQQTQNLKALALESEQGDAILGSRIDSLEGLISAKGPVRQPVEKQTVDYVPPSPPPLQETAPLPLGPPEVPLTRLHAKVNVEASQQGTDEAGSSRLEHTDVKNTLNIQEVQKKVQLPSETTPTIPSTNQAKLQTPLSEASPPTPLVSFLRR